MLDSPDRLRAFHVMVKPRGSICNLDCQYCFYLKKEKLYPGQTFRMSSSLLEEYTLQYISAQTAPAATFAWQGGEPTLMGLPFFQKAVELQEKYRRTGMTIQNTFQTNGTLLDADWGRFFHEHNFLVGLSIDGPRRLHDAYRQDKGGGPTYDRVLRAARLLQEHKVEFNTLTCVSAANAAHGLEVYRFLRDEIFGSAPAFMQFIPIVERHGADGFQRGRRVTARSVHGEAYGRFLIDIFEEWLRRDVGRAFVQIFDSALAAWAGQPPGVCIYAETCGANLAMEFNGDVFSCDHFVEPRYRLGSLNQDSLSDLVNTPRQVRFGLAKKEDLPRFCRECPVRFACNGGCPKDRLLTTPQGEPGLNYLCAGYRSFFTFVDRPMKMMAALLRAGRAPAEVMRLVANDPALREQPDAAPCPCGSGKSVGNCHRPAVISARRKR